ncbi:MAG: ATP-binding cassette domain-containing protein [Sphingomonadales bacterium]|nr:ATP-binding cassette domain-containing protein [Sphingomonadales bacterium]NCO48687.1 ATP-binding cassette domain-containing protein [Sphingomonadales bacterium]NCP01693.1 ATP-binding cassette domain-containing protein [Sphingomonadales bacterium]NCP25962.1 ATP-binding cassette domain-containing protein [Sphingomonadales bacterium]NCP43208.1 ATP-binding cassette domain-containing protein [Sphingomonadales bacterium]
MEARNIVKRFDGEAAVDGIDLAIKKGSIFGILGPNGAGKTTTLRMLLGIIDPDEGERFLLGSPDPISKAHQVGYLPEERGLYQSMKAYDAIAFMGALRGLPLAEGRKRGRRMMEDHGLGDAADKQIRQLSKGMAQTVQLLGTLVHEPDLIILDEPFSGLDALNQGKLERLIRDQADKGVTIIFSTHVIAHAERLCEEIAIIAEGKIPFKGKVSTARDRLRPQVHLETRNLDGPWRTAIPADCKPLGHNWHFTLPESGVEPLLHALVEGGAGIESLSIERPGLHDAFVQIAGEAAARKMKADAASNNQDQPA